MNENSIPILFASVVISGNKTIFNTYSREVIVEAPGIVIGQIVNLCDGSNRFKDIVDTLATNWDRESVSNLIEDLFQKQVIVDGRSLEGGFWEVVTNPMRFSTNVSNDQVTQLVKRAKERHREEIPEKFYQPSRSSFSKIIEDRKSVRSFSGELVSLQTVIDLLWVAYGECLDRNGREHRTVPSAGALYPLMIHIGLFAKTGDLETGVYRVLYGQDGSLGFKLISSDILRFARSFLNPAGIQRGVHGVVVISGSFLVSNQKYGNRSMLYVPLEAGHSAQNVLLEASRQNVATLEIGGFVDELLSKSLGLPIGYRPLTLVAFGKETNETEPDKTTLMEVDWAIPMARGYNPDFAIASARLVGRRSWSHGRDPSPEIALKKAVSEAKEWAACGCISDLTHATYKELDNAIDPREIIRFHPNQYRSTKFPFGKFCETTKYGWTKGIDLDGKEFYVLADHVYFPYFPETPYYCYSNSSGCAAHPDKQTAIEIGTLELVERDAFVNSYLCKLDMPIVSENTLPFSIQKRIQDLQSVGFRVWVVDHSLDLAPVAFVMAQNMEFHFTTCASCSSFDVEYAVSHALTEVEASVLHRLQSGGPDKIKPSDVVWPNDHGRLYGQRQYFQKADFLFGSQREVSFQEIGNCSAHTWAGLLDRFRSAGWKHLVVPLELSDDYGGNGNLNIARAIVPGIVQMTFGYRQEPAGMMRIYDIAKRFGKGEMSYRQLTKFPHPFE